MPMLLTPMDVLPILTPAMFTLKHVCNYCRASCRALLNRMPLLLSLKMSTLRLTRDLALEPLPLLNGVHRPQLEDPLRSLRLPLGKLRTGIVASMNFNHTLMLRLRLRLKLKRRLPKLPRRKLRRKPRPRRKPKPKLRPRPRRKRKLKHKHRLKHMPKRRLRRKLRPRLQMASIIVMFVAQRSQAHVRNQAGCSLKRSARNLQFALLRLAWPVRALTTPCPSSLMLPRHPMNEFPAVLVPFRLQPADPCPQLLLQVARLAVLRLLGLFLLITTDHSLRHRISISDRCVMSELLRLVLAIRTSSSTMVPVVLQGEPLRLHPQWLLRKQLLGNGRIDLHRQ